MFRDYHIKGMKMSRRTTIIDPEPFTIHTHPCLLDTDRLISRTINRDEIKKFKKDKISIKMV